MEIKIEGKYNSAVILTPDPDGIEEYTKQQVKMICDNKLSKGTTIKVMPDAHPGKVGPIGLTMVIYDHVCPSLLGNDIGCGVMICELGKIKPDFVKLDKVIRENIPVGLNVRIKPHPWADTNDIDKLFCRKHVRSKNAILSIGTLGGGNHFIELDKDDEDNVYLIVHSGSRGPGAEVASYYQKRAYEICKKEDSDIPFELSYLSGSTMWEYLNDACIMTEYASINREAIVRDICKGMKWNYRNSFQSVHNSVERERQIGYYILRKGAIRSGVTTDVVIPINMKDGVILGKGLNNPNWNYSAPHGSGRVNSREWVKKSHTLSEYKKEMVGIHSICINKATLDEAPFAYRREEYIVNAIKDTVKIEKILKPIYNFKASE